MVTPPRKLAERGMARELRRVINDVIDYMRESTPIGGIGVTVKRTSNGSLIKAAEVRDTGSEIQQFKLKSVQGDYLTCRSWNGTSEGDKDIFIAKPFELRRDPFDQQTIAYDDFTASYSYTNNTQRTETIDGATEEQVVIPRFKADFSLIYAVECRGLNISTVDDDPISLVDLNLAGRAWAGPANV